MKIKDIPKIKRPREKLIARGPQNLFFFDQTWQKNRHRNLQNLQTEKVV